LVLVVGGSTIVDYRKLRYGRISNFLDTIILMKFDDQNR